MKNLSLLLLSFFAWQSLMAQPPPDHKWVEVIVTPSHANWTYAIGEEVEFTVTVLHKNVPLKGTIINYSIGPEKMASTIENQAILNNGAIEIMAGTMDKPGFLRCTVTTEYGGKTYSGLATAAFEPENIRATVEKPIDFDTFWAESIAENASLPLDPKMTLLPERCTENVNVYHVSLQNWKPGARLYGILCVPKAEGNYPAVLKVPGAGIRPYKGDIGFAEEGIISFEIGIHGISVILSPQIYDDLLAKWNNQYWNNNVHDKDSYFYKRVYLGLIKANDFITSLPQWDGQNLGVMGGSQGGALSLVTAGLDKRVTAVAPIYPALCDMTGYLFDRAGGWPHYLADKEKWELGSHSEIVATLSYYDAVNFAKNITAPVWLSFGYNDLVVPPTSVYAAYNSISSPKETFLAEETGHWVYPEQQQKQREWMMEQLMGE